MTRAIRCALVCALACFTAACEVAADDEPMGAGGSAGTPPPQTGGRTSEPPRDAEDPHVPDAEVPRTCGPEGECDVRALDDCGEGLSCVLLLASSSDEDGGVAAGDEDAGPSSSPGPVCIAAGAGRDGDACEGPRECGPGLDCTAEHGGQCRRYCCELNTTAGCPSGQFCRVELRDAHGDGTGLALCDACDGCDVLGADCPGGQACYPLATASGTCNACLPAGELAPGTACDFSNECARGGACVELAGARRCAELCTLGEARCGAGRACAAVDDEPFGAGVGLCVDSAER